MLHRRRLALVTLAVLGIMPLRSGAVAQVANEPVIIASERRLEQIRRQRLQLGEEMLRMRARVGDFSAEREILDRQMGSAVGVVEELEFQAARREEQIERTREDLRLTRQHLVDRRAVLHSRLREIYKRGPMQTAQVLLAAESFSDLLNRYRYLFLIARHDRLLAEDVALLEAQLVARERALRTSLAQLDRIRSEARDEQGYLASLRGQQRFSLVRAAAPEGPAISAAGVLEREEQRLRDLLPVLELRRTASAPAITPAVRGTLEWPGDGEIIYGFGAVSRVRGAVDPARGIGIGGPRGTPVRAGAAGTVTLSGKFEGFGPTVILSHGAGYYSLYLFLQQADVRQGEVVSSGQPIGTLGGTAEGAFFEFQIREGSGTALDPIVWLRSR